MNIGQRLAKRRKDHHLKQADIAIRINESQQVISNIERGVTMPDIEQLKKIADVYSISLDELVGREFSGEDRDEIEKQIMNYIKEMDKAEKELSLDILSQVARHRRSNDGK